MPKWSFLIIFLLFTLVIPLTEGQARRTHLTPDQKAKLRQAETIFVNVLAITEQGQIEFPALQDTVSRRLQELGYTVVTDRNSPFDIEFRVKCEERKTWTGTTPAGGDAELADAPARLWKGPACLFSYKLSGQDLGWRKEVRTSFEDAVQAAKAAKVQDSGLFAMQQLVQQLEVYDFPVLLAAEWGQTEKLLSLLDSPTTPKLRKLKILSILDELQSDVALPHLRNIMKDKDLAQEAIVAMAGAGQDSIPLLIDLFTTAKQDDIKAAAAKALGEIAAASGDPRTIPPLLNYLKAVLPKIKTSADINFPVLTQVVWSLGKLRDEDSIGPIAELNEKIWLIYDPSPAMAELREAANWTYKQLDLDGHIS